MQNFVSRCIQTINNHRNLNVIEHKSGSTNDQTTLGTDNQELSNVIGVLPPRLPNVQRKDPRPGSASRNPEMPGQVVEIDGMVSSLPTLSGSYSFPPNLTRRQMQQIINARCSSDQNINSGPKSEQGIVQSEEDILRYSAASSSTRGGSMSGRWVGLDCPEENLHTSQNGFLGGSTSSPVSAVKTKASGAVHDMVSFHSRPLRKFIFSGWRLWTIFFIKLDPLNLIHRLQISVGILIKGKALERNSTFF